VIEIRLHECGKRRGVVDPPTTEFDAFSVEFDR
jgi:hypothetical protein